MFYLFIYLFIYLFMAALSYSPALVIGGSRKFYTWWTLSVIREVTTWIFSWSSLNYRVDGPKSDEIWHIFIPRPQTFCSHARTRQNIVILKKKLVKHRWFLYNVCHVWWTLAYTNPWDPRDTKFLKKWHAWIACDTSYYRLLDASTTTPEPLNLNSLIPTP